MYDSVRSSFNSFTKTFEGRVPWMYLDIKGLVTVAVGNLIDPVDAALSLPFVHKTDNTPATKDEIRAEWTSLKAKTDLATKGYKACESITNLRLTDPGMDSLVDSKLTLDETALKKSFPNWDEWPADAQLGVLSMAWALGAGFAAKWPKFAAAAKAGDWVTASSNCAIDTTGNPGVVKRNDADIKLFKNAAAVIAKKLDASKLYYPADVPASAESPSSGASSQSSTGASTGNGASTQPSSPTPPSTAGTTDPSTSSDSDPSTPSDQTDPSASSDASTPSDQTDPSTSSDNDPSTPSDQTDPSASDDASTPSDESDAGASDDASTPSDQTDPSTSSDSDPSTPSDPTDPGDPSESTDPDPAAGSSDSSSSDTVDGSDSSADQAASVGSG
jgi:GH24 family phage-related lysozyme (muramidase)